MNLDKQQIEEEIKKANIGQRVFFIVSMVSFALCITLLVLAIVFGATKKDDSWYVFGYCAGLLMCLGFTFLICRSVFFVSKIKILNALKESHTTANINIAPEVEARPISEHQETREEKLVKEYEKLFKQGYITQEEFEAKKAEILKK